MILALSVLCSWPPWHVALKEEAERRPPSEPRRAQATPSAGRAWQSPNPQKKRPKPTWQQHATAICPRHNEDWSRIWWFSNRHIPRLIFTVCTKCLYQPNNLDQYLCQDAACRTGLLTIVAPKLFTFCIIALLHPKVLGQRLCLHTKNDLRQEANFSSCFTLQRFRRL